MDEDDDFGFFPAGSSRLSSLFPTNHSNEDDVNQSLTYVPPKQPKKNDGQSSSNNKNLQLIHAVAAYTYKLEGGQYTSLGKLGAAILGDRDTAVYKLLLYKGKQLQITWCTINAQFKFVAEANNYAKFPDDKGEQWSITFSSEDELASFAKQVAIARANSCGKIPSNLIVQDLVSGEGGILANGDSAEIAYTGSLFKNFGFGEVFDDSAKKDKPFIVRLGKTKVIKGITEGLLGAKKGARRLLVIPPALGYGAEGFANLVPPNATLIFEIHVKKVKISRDTSHSPSPGKKESESKPDVPPRTQSVSDDSIRSRGASISEQLTLSPRKDNAKLIQRMAKMGMPTLPIHGTATTHTSSESEPEREVEHDHPHSRTQSAASVKIPSAPNQREVDQNRESVAQRRRNSSAPQAANQQFQKETELESEVFVQPRRNISVPQAPSPHLQISGVPYSTIPVESTAFIQQPFQPHAMTPLISSVLPGVLETHIPLLISETRTQNTEVRLTLGKISDKVDTVIQKLDDSRSQLGSTVPLHGQVPYMESAVLAQNIERIIQENMRLKSENESKNSKIQELNEKICDILQRNQRFFEESNNILEQRSDSLQMTTSQLQNKILTLEQEKAKLSSEHSQSLSRFNSTQSQVGELQASQAELQNKLAISESNNRQQNELITSLKEQCTANEVLIKSFTASLEESKQENDSLNLKLTRAEEALKSSKEAEEDLQQQMRIVPDGDKLSESEKQQNELKAEIEKLLVWKKKYDTLHQNTRLLKDRYENQILSLVSEMKKMKNTALQTTTQTSTKSFSAEIKKAMNILYKLLQNEVTVSQMYSGSQVLQLSLAVIRRVTLTIIEKDQHAASISQKSVSEKIVNQEGNDKESENSASMLDRQSAASDEHTSRVPSLPDSNELVPTEVPAMKENHHGMDSNAEDSARSFEAPAEVKIESSVVTNKESDHSGTQSLLMNDKEKEEEQLETAKKENLEDGKSKKPDELGEETVPKTGLDAPEKEDEGRETPEIWKPEPPPLFDDDEEDEDDWLK